jgi:hypothetical protein
LNCKQERNKQDCLGAWARSNKEGLLGLGQIGAQQQGLGQAGLQSAYEEFQRALGYGPQQFGLLQAGAFGTPLINKTEKQRTGPGDVLSSIFGIFG